MPAWLLPALGIAADIGLGLLGASGQSKTNKQNVQQADRTNKAQMDFQERMSSTSVQRSVEDYRKAGLNPGLAYDRSASSPGGSGVTAQIGNVTEAGISSAQSSRRLRNDLAIAKANIDAANAAATRDRTQAAANSETAQLTSVMRARAEQDKTFQFALQPFMLQKAAADATLSQLLIPESKSSARFYTDMLQGIGPGMNAARTAAEIFKLFRGNR